MWFFKKEKSTGTFGMYFSCFGSLWIWDLTCSHGRIWDIEISTNSFVLKRVGKARTKKIWGFSDNTNKCTIFPKTLLHGGGRSHFQVNSKFFIRESQIVENEVSVD